MAESMRHSIIYRSFFMSCFLVIFAFAKAYSQRNSNDIVYRNANVKVVNILLESTIELEIKTTTNRDIRISSSQGGEYKNAVVLSSQIVNDTLKINDPFNPSFRFPQDKLSTHKIIDGKAILYIPENLEIQLTARDCFITISGKFKTLFVNMQSGDCNLLAIKGDFHIISVHAAVSVSKQTSMIETITKYGLINKKENFKRVVFKQKIETIDGDITFKD